jgi:hypothetical protein
MDRIARLTRSDLERKLRDARQALREIASAMEDAEPGARSAQFATWALELIFDEQRTIDRTAESFGATLDLSADAGSSFGETVPFPVRERRPVRGSDDCLAEAPLRRVRG